MKKLIFLFTTLIIFGCKTNRKPVEVIKTDAEKTLITIDEHGRAHILRKPIKKR